MRRVDVNGQPTLMDYCTGPSFASGGFIADSQFDGGPITNGSQQQWFTRNSTLDGWSNGVWNQVFSGVVGAPAQCFPCANPYTTIPTSPVTREAPYLYADASGNDSVFAPVGADQHLRHRRGPRADPRHVDPDRRSSTSRSRPTPRPRSTTPSRRARTCSSRPGIYDLDRSINVNRAGHGRARTRLPDARSRRPVTRR